LGAEKLESRKIEKKQANKTIKTEERKEMQKG